MYSLSKTQGRILRAALLVAAASLALYIPYKYLTQLHAITGLYAFLFPLSGGLAAAGILLAVNPGKACDCSVAVRSGLAVLSGLWLAIGVRCVGTLTESVIADPLQGTIASFHMLTQHVFLSLMLMAFAVAPQRMARALGAEDPARHSMEAAAA